MSTISLLLAAAASTGVPNPVAPDFTTVARLQPEFAPAHADLNLSFGAVQDAPEPLPDPAPTAQPFGTAHSTRWTLQGAYGFEPEHGSQMMLLGGGISYFLAEGFSINFELMGGGFWQTGPTAAGVNFNLLFRWHFLRKETWTIFLDGGAGFLFTSENVPKIGTNYNFTPQFGVGVSFDAGDTARILVGIRWQHISNANLSTPNPGRDSLEFWAGASFPF
jgi:hypothetical protein